MRAIDFFAAFLVGAVLTAAMVELDPAPVAVVVSAGLDGVNLAWAVAGR